MDIGGAFTFFQSKGWTPAQSAGIVGNLSYESGGWNPNAVGDGGRAYGLGQWHPDRQNMFQRVFGRPIRGSSVEQQLSFVDWELRNTEQRAGAILRRANTVEDATYSVARYYERPANLSSVGKRTGIAKGLLDQGKGLLSQAISQGLGMATNAIPGGQVLLGGAQATGLVGGCGPICQLQNWIKESGFFQRLAIAFLAFIMLFAAFYLMKGNSVSQVLTKAKEGLTNG